METGQSRTPHLTTSSECLDDVASSILHRTTILQIS